jgi:predicted RNA-binding Zn-ribbon protein involved in translation (DUF1610 family)
MTTERRCKCSACIVVNSPDATHLWKRDRAALVLRLFGALAGLSTIAWAFTTSSMGSAWVVTLILAVVVGGAVAYHLLTSLVRCPKCGTALVNLQISGSDAHRKLFRCNKCGSTAYLHEGFYWQRDTSG